MSSRLKFGLILATILCATPAFASITIDSYTFDVVPAVPGPLDLGQFTGSAVTYRADGGVTFDGKVWDNHVGVDMATSGELAAGQFGSDPGDQISLNDRTTPDWFQLNYAGPGLTVGGSTYGTTFVVYEITSSRSGVDVEGTSWEISFNGGSLIDASMGVATFLDYGFYSGSGVENVNQIAFDLSNPLFNFTDTELNSVYIQNKDSGDGTSDPDFIFTALESAANGVVPEPSSLLVWGLLGAAVGLKRRSQRRG